MKLLIDLFHKFKQYIVNTSWLFAEKVVQLSLGFGVTILIARHLGPERFGVLSFALSMVALFSIAGHLGLNGLLIRDIVKNKEERAEMMGTALVLKLAGVFVGFLAILGIAFFSEKPGSAEFWVLCIVSLSLFLTPVDVLDSWFQAYVQVKYAAIARMAGITVSAVFRLLLVVLGSGLILFSFANLIQLSLVALILVWFYKKKADISLKEWLFSKAKSKEFFVQGWKIFLGAIFAMVYLKIDQVMLNFIAGKYEVGIYSVASRISEAWYFIPAAIVASVFPKLIQLRSSDPEKFTKRFQQLLDMLFLFSFAIAIVVTLFADPLIPTVFGAEYHDSAAILMVHIWASLFIFMRAAFSRWILIEGELLFSLISQGSGALSNIILNMLLIPEWGGMGAALSTLISYAIASYGSLVLYSKTRKVFTMMSKAFLAPFRYPIMYLHWNKRKG